MAAEWNKDNFEVLLWERKYTFLAKNGHLLIQSRKRHLFQAS